MSDPIGFRKNLQLIKGKVAQVIGIDVDSAVLDNPAVDRAVVIGPDGRFPVDDASVDLVVSDFTFEHVQDPVRFAGEIDRVLRLGGWVCARTPNKWGLIAIFARLVPNRLHDMVLRKVQPEKEPRDTFPTAYRMNTAYDLRQLFPECRYRDHSYTFDSEPAYAGSSPVGWRLVRLLARVSPSSLRSMRFVFLERM